MCNRDCMDTELKLLLFLPCQGKLNITIQDIQNMLGLIIIVVFPWFPHMQIYLPSKRFSVYCEKTF